MSTKKLKFGLDAMYTPLSWLGAGVRFDQVRPDMDNAYSRNEVITGDFKRWMLGQSGWNPT